MVNFKQLAVLAGVMAVSNAVNVATTSKANAVGLFDNSVTYSVNPNHKERTGPFFKYQPDVWKAFEDGLKEMSPNELANTVQRYTASGFDLLAKGTVTDIANGFSKLATAQDILVDEGSLGKHFRGGDGKAFKDHVLMQIRDVTYSFMDAYQQDITQCFGGYLLFRAKSGAINSVPGSDPEGKILGNLVTFAMDPVDYKAGLVHCDKLATLRENTTAYAPKEKVLDLIKEPKSSIRKIIDSIHNMFKYDKSPKPEDSPRQFHLGQLLEGYAKLHGPQDNYPLVNRDWVPNLTDRNKTRDDAKLTVKYMEQAWTRATSNQLGEAVEYIERTQRNKKDIQGLFSVNDLVNGKATYRNKSGAEAHVEPLAFFSVNQLVTFNPNKWKAPQYNKYTPTTK